MRSWPRCNTMASRAAPECRSPEARVACRARCPGHRAACLPAVPECGWQSAQGAQGRQAGAPVRSVSKCRKELDMLDSLRWWWWWWCWCESACGCALRGLDLSPPPWPDPAPPPDVQLRKLVKVNVSVPICVVQPHHRLQAGPGSHVIPSLWPHLFPRAAATTFTNWAPRRGPVS